MRYLGLTLVCCAVLFSPFSLAVDVSKIYGRIQIVDYNEDYRVRIVDSREHLRVQEVTAFANRPGEWEIVDNFLILRLKLSTLTLISKLDSSITFPAQPDDDKSLSYAGNPQTPAYCPSLHFLPLALTLLFPVGSVLYQQRRADVGTTSSFVANGVHDLIL
ncbi:hypothetical protein [Pectobacterium carotovorum]|uniref:hypothetical protein n=1 Tax=Pectobacterium carotovorum TaxID=554 RepID=UPI001CF454B9|nr:hypothetical protein [Pectobacterium carotovorum]MCA6974255.1 hypothetical protein [Pectobacterium carotovorum]